MEKNMSNDITKTEMVNTHPQKPRVLFIMHMPPPVHGAAMMGKYVYDSKLINDSFDCKYINETLSINVNEVGKFGFSKIKTLFNHVHTIYNEVKEYSPDLVYITPGGADPEPGMIRYVFEFWVLNMHGCKKLIHFHNKGTKEKTSKWYVRWYYKMMFKNSNVIFISNLLKSQYESYLKPEQIHICPNGIPESLNYTPKAERNNAKPKILFLSNLIIAKGVLVLLDSIKLLKDRGYELVCDYVGAETYDLTSDTFSEEIQKRGLGSCVKYHGKKYGDEKARFFQNADIFAFPTFCDTFGLVNLEAMEYKLPVISTNVGGIPDVVQDGKNGFLCDANNPYDLADCIERLLNDKELRIRMGEEGYKMFKKQFTVKCFEEKMKTIIDSVL